VNPSLEPSASPSDTPSRSPTSVPSLSTFPSSKPSICSEFYGMTFHFFQPGLCLKVETFVGGGVKVWTDPTLTNLSECSGPGITGNYVKLSHFDKHTTTQATYVSSVTPADWSGIAHFVGDANIKKDPQLKILQFNGTGSANPLTFEIEIKVPVTKGCESASPSLTPSKELSAFPSLLPSILPSRLPSMIPSVPPSRKPSSQPSGVPSYEPTFLPSDVPSVVPTNMPSYDAGNLNNNDMYFNAGFQCFRIQFRLLGTIDMQTGNVSNCNSSGFQGGVSLSEYDSASGNKIHFAKIPGAALQYSASFTIEFTDAVSSVSVSFTLVNDEINALVRFPSGYTIVSGADILAILA
jgi:hypothetical protein